MEWISVKDRLPEINVAVLCFYTIEATDAKRKKTGKIHKYWTVGFIEHITDYGNNNKSTYWTDKNHDTINPTHWMPLPEPPKESQ